MPKVPTTPGVHRIAMEAEDAAPAGSPSTASLARKIKELPSAGRVLVEIAAARANDDKPALDRAYAKAKRILEADRGAADAQGLETIRQYAADLEEFKVLRKAAENRLLEIEQPWAEAREVERIGEELLKAQERLKGRRLTSTEYLNQTEKVAKIKRDEQEAKEILSSYLLYHYRKTGEMQVLMDEENGDARVVILTGRLGAKTKYQTSLDLAPESDE